MAQLRSGTRIYGNATIDNTLSLNGISLSKGVSGVLETGYSTGGNGLNMSPFWVRQNASRTKTTNNTVLEAVFSPANDTISLLANTLYYFRGAYIISTSATGTAAGINIGFVFSVVQQNIEYKVISYTTASSTTQTSLYVTVPTTTTVTATGTVATPYVIEIEGYFKSNASTGGTLIPAFSQSVAGTTVAPAVGTNTWFTLQPISVANTTRDIISGAWV
jgi:hypothetical protein